jgi:branched-chain amino acid transport system ATP-binding protein
MSAVSLLQLDGLVKRFGGLLVTDHVSLTIDTGQLHAVIGPNGAGKTTLVNQIVGELAPDEGRILFCGEEITSWPVYARARAGLGRSYQINSVIGEFTVLENVLLAAQSLRGHSFRFWRPAESDHLLHDRAYATIGMLGLHEEAGRVASTLAYGQQRLIELAMALVTGPKLLLLDEPMAGLGSAESEAVIAILQKIRRDYAILLIEHDMQAVFSLADTISVLVQGQVVLQDRPEAVRNSAKVREAYLGDEEIQT